MLLSCFIADIFVKFVECLSSHTIKGVAWFLMLLFIQTSGHTSMTLHTFYCSFLGLGGFLF